uniref:hypothetical protein n=1 Tax=Capnocytophaga leadbetteri TaxID=327575 RepID=UPI0026EAFDE4
HTGSVSHTDKNFGKVDTPTKQPPIRSSRQNGSDLWDEWRENNAGKVILGCCEEEVLWFIEKNHHFETLKLFRWGH